jgi:hypothetical protein
MTKYRGNINSHKQFRELYDNGVRMFSDSVFKNVDLTGTIEGCSFENCNFLESAIEDFTCKDSLFKDVTFLINVSLEDCLFEDTFFCGGDSSLVTFVPHNQFVKCSFSDTRVPSELLTQEFNECALFDLTVAPPKPSIRPEITGCYFRFNDGDSLSSIFPLDMALEVNVPKLKDYAVVPKSYYEELVETN